MEQLALPWVVAVAEPEFEAWLIADIAAVSAALDQPVAEAPRGRKLKPRQAKEQLAAWLSGSGSRATRREIVAHADLAHLASRSRSFERFTRDVATVLAAR